MLNSGHAGLVSGTAAGRCDNAGPAPSNWTKDWLKDDARLQALGHGHDFRGDLRRADADSIATRNRSAPSVRCRLAIARE